MDYAVIKTGGKQYRVKPGDTLDVEKLPIGVNSIAEFGEVLAISDGGEVTFGSPYITGAKVLAQVQSHYKDRKIIVFKYKAKTRYRRKRFLQVHQVTKLPLLALTFEFQLRNLQ